MKVLIAYDGSEYAEAALHDLRRAGLPQQVEAVVIAVADVLLPPPRPFISETTTTGFPADMAMAGQGARAQALHAVQESYALAKGASERLRTIFPTWDVHAEAHGDAPAWAIIKKADEWDADLVVVGSQGRSMLGRILLGSVSQTVVTHARCAVRVARGSSTVAEGPVRLVVGVDGSPDAETAIRVIAERDWPEGSEVLVITAFDRKMATAAQSGDASDVEARGWVREMLEASAQKLRAAGLQVSTMIKEGDPKRLLPDEAERLRADAIFLGARGLGRIERLLLGSVSAAVAARAHCSVEVIRARQQP
jgi:nucleotide-binding universal stress UspA family protein